MTAGDALCRVVPQVPNSVKWHRKVGRALSVDRDHALFRILVRTKPANGVVAGLATAKLPNVQSANVASAVHESANTVLATHVSISAYARERRYRSRLADYSTHVDLCKIGVGPGLNLSQVAIQDDFDSRRQLVNAIISHPSTGEPDATRDHMRDILLCRYIADVCGKARMQTSLYRGAMSMMGIGATTALAIGSHGVVPAAIAGGAVLSGRDLLDNRGAMVSLKQYYRDKKAERITDVAIQNLMREENALTESRLLRELAHARGAVDEHNISRFFPLKFGRINERKSTARKREEITLVKARATELVMGVIEESDQEKLRAAFTAPSSNETTSKRALQDFYRDVKDTNPDFESACQLMRDLGMSKMESISRLRSAVGSCLANAGGAEVLANLATQSDPALRNLALKPDSTLAAAIDTAMTRT